MRNQTSFRLTTTLLPTDTTAKTTTVINKLDASGNKFYPTFTEETVVLTNDDRTVMETTRATCNNGVLTFVKRWLSDDNSETQVANRKLTWNPWSLCFITAWAWDWIDKDDSITRTGNQTYTGNLTSTWNATYNGYLITNKWVKYPHFNTVADLEAYNDPFGWMFAVVDSTWELYRYNAVTQEWSVIEASTPSNPEMASTITIWTVRWATDTEFNNWESTWSQWELLVATPNQIRWLEVKKATPSRSGTVKVASKNQFLADTYRDSDSDYLLARIDYIKTAKLMYQDIRDENNQQIKIDSLTDKDQTKEVTFTMPFDWFFTVHWEEQFLNWVRVNFLYATNAERFSYFTSTLSWNSNISHYDAFYANKNASVTITLYSTDLSYNWSDVSPNSKRASVTGGFYFWFDLS